jgi:hypothetical protein
MAVMQLSRFFLLLVLAAAEVLIDGELAEVSVRPSLEPFTVVFLNGTLLQDFVHVDVQNDASQRIAGPFVWIQLVPAFQLLLPNDTLQIVPKTLIFDKFGRPDLRFHSFVVGYRLLVNGTMQTATQFFRFRFTPPPTEDLTVIWSVGGVFLGLLVVLALSALYLSGTKQNDYARL